MKATTRAQKKDKYKFIGRQGSTANFTYRDLKRNAVMLGMPFPDTCAASIFKLEKFIRDSTNKPDPSLIDQYDEWMDNQLAECGYSKDDALRNSRLRLGFLGEENEEGRKRRKIRGVKKPREKKAPREKDQFNLVKGTKKSYAWELTAKGFDLERVTRRLKKKFPDANDKSISLWYRNCKRYLKENGKA